MTIVISKNNMKKIDELLKERLRERSKSGNLKQHFGKLKRNIDGLTYQKDMRKDEE